MEQKKFMDIARIKEEDSELCMANVGGFEKEDFVVIQEKVDGANASVRYDVVAGKLTAFSRKQELTYDKTLNGFWNYVQGLDVLPFADHPEWVFFGEWLLKNAIQYQSDAYSKWYIFDIFDTSTGKYLPQECVREFCEKNDLIYVKTFYEGPFVSWEHCKSFVGQSDIAVELGEGVVIKNQTKLNDENTKMPFVLKIVSGHFKEVQKRNHIAKVQDPQKLKARAAALDIVESVVTKRRVEKELFKMRDEGVIPEKVRSEDMGIIAKHLPKRIYEDCLKEEYEAVVACGEYFGKLCNGVVMKWAKELILKQ